VNESNVSACTDCGTTIIGGRSIDRCRVCQERAVRKDSLGQLLLSGVVFAEILVMIACGLWLLGRGCTP
jgi:hypothetical protein